MELFIPEEIKKISSILNNEGFECFLVGGAIRNQLLGKNAKDFDLTTNAEPLQVTKLFKRVIPTGIKHGTVTILMGDHSYEITTYRIDGKYTDGRRPDKIEFTPSIHEDLLRRDFTINSIAYDLNNNTILDINDGISDLNKKVIKAIGVPSKRFDEDALRLVRACRFASQLNFSIDTETYNAMSQTLSKLPDVSKERISEELLKILESNHPSIAFEHFYSCKMLEILFPSIYMASLQNNQEFHKSLRDIDTIKTKKPYIRFSRLLSITPPEDHLSTLKSLKLSNEFISSCLHLLKFIYYNFDKLKTEHDYRCLISKVGTDNLDDLITIWLGMEDTDKDVITLIIEKINVEISSNCPFHISDLKITGNDLMSELNLMPGPNIGSLLKKLLSLTLEYPNLNEREKLINCAKQELEN